MAIKEKFIQIAENEQKVYEAGKEKQRFEFWDDIQEKGQRTIYNNAFQNSFTDFSFQPIYDIKPTNAGYMFNGTKIENMKKCLADNGVELDFSNATSMDRVFANSIKLTYLPTISTVSASVNHTQNIFYECKSLISIDKFILKEDGSQTFNDNSFKNCSSLQHIIFEGVIGNTLNMQWSKLLDAESIDSILSCLSTTASGVTLTLPTTAEATYDAKYGSGAYAAKLATKSNWKIKTA